MAGTVNIRTGECKAALRRLSPSGLSPDRDSQANGVLQRDARSYLSLACVAIQTPLCFSEDVLSAAQSRHMERLPVDRLLYWSPCFSPARCGTCRREKTRKNNYAKPHSILSIQIPCSICAFWPRLPPALLPFPFPKRASVRFFSVLSLSKQTHARGKGHANCGPPVVSRERGKRLSRSSSFGAARPQKRAEADIKGAFSFQHLPFSPTPPSHAHEW